MCTVLFSRQSLGVPGLWSLGKAVKHLCPYVRESSALADGLSGLEKTSICATRTPHTPLAPRRCNGFTVRGLAGLSGPRPLVLACRPLTSLALVSGILYAHIPSSAASLQRSCFPRLSAQLSLPSGPREVLWVSPGFQGPGRTALPDGQSVPVGVPLWPTAGLLIDFACVQGLKRLEMFFVN